MNINKVLIIGAGTMGAGIATWFAQNDVSADLVDINSEVSKKAESNILKLWEKLLQKGKFTPKDILDFKERFRVKNFDEIDTDYDLVIEAIIENFSIKAKLFQDLDKKLESKTVFSSNTSSISITNLASKLKKERQEKFLGIHFFNPAPIMKLVEIIKGIETSPELLEKLKAWFSEKNKVPAICKDSPGFIVNRVARNYYGESLRIAKIQDEEKLREIDQVLETVGGFKMGPFKLMDLIGIDVNLDVTHSVWNAFDQNPRFAPHSLQISAVKNGHFGKKTKKGFYNYES